VSVRKVCGGAEVYIHLFLTLALVGGERSVSHSCFLTPEERSKLNRRLSGPQSRSGCFGKERYFLPLTRIELAVLGRSACNLAVAIPITVQRTVALPLVMYGCETEFSVLKGEQKLRIFENRVSSKIHIGVSTNAKEKYPCA
jgi:hypothetical protein